MFDLLFDCSMFWPFLIKGTVYALVIGGVALLISHFTYHDELDDSEDQ
ncbi:MAG: hypothetical protein LUD79_05395 [Oscillospiraceae bacterium]|nr:hypothetical protein [Oscillospiraceae bacterium]